MITLPTAVPTWVWVLLIAPVAFFAGSPVCGWWPKNARKWQFYGAVLAGFVGVCVVMICVLHVR